MSYTALQLDKSHTKIRIHETMVKVKIYDKFVKIDLKYSLPETHLLQLKNCIRTCRPSCRVCRPTLCFSVLLIRSYTPCPEKKEPIVFEA